MMKKETMGILSSRFIAKDTVELILKNEYISQNARPGQFLHVSVIGHTLRRPISIASVDPIAKTVTILFKMVGEGTRKLASYAEGMSIDVLGPNGNGFPLPDAKAFGSVLLIGGGIGVPPLYFLAQCLQQSGISVQAVLGFQQKDYVFYEKEFQEIADTSIVTNDGSYGNHGFVTDVLGDVARFDRYYTCGPLPMLKAVYHALQEREGYLSFEERMGCGIGACYACVIPIKGAGGYKKICHEGPVFAASEVKL
jgi:dihydroorotate dehydrogenase electron transfer subunit